MGTLLAAHTQGFEGMLLEERRVPLRTAAEMQHWTLPKPHPTGSLPAIEACAVARSSVNVPRRSLM